MSKTTHGGARKNSGRKRVLQNPKRKTITFTAEKEVEINEFIKSVNIYVTKKND